MIAGVAELVDARHSKCRSQKECRFDSDRPHQPTRRRDKEALGRLAGALHRALPTPQLCQGIQLTFRPWSSALTRRKSNQIDPLHILRIATFCVDARRPTCCNALFRARLMFFLDAPTRNFFGPAVKPYALTDADNGWGRINAGLDNRCGLEPAFGTVRGDRTKQRRPQDGAFDASNSATSRLKLPSGPISKYRSTLCELAACSARMASTRTFGVLMRSTQEAKSRRKR
jgi:hypothetical protein